MGRLFLILLFMLLSGTGILYAQWSRSDSLWLQRILSGKDSIRLNIETMRAIERGSLLNDGLPEAPMMMSRPNLEITKDFSEYLDMPPDSTRKIALRDLPPAVFWHHQIKYKAPRYQVNPDILKMYEQKQSAFSESPKTSGTVGVSGFGIGNLDFAHALNYVFSKEYRRHLANQKMAERLIDYKLGADGNGYKPARSELPLPLVTYKKKEVKDTISADPAKAASPHPATIRSATAQDSLSVESQADSLLNKTRPTLTLPPAK
jgi:hypothetical protein